MSNYGLSFLSTIREECMASTTDNPDPMQFVNAGYLFLAGTQNGSDCLQKNHATQQDVGVLGSILLKGGLFSSTNNNNAIETSTDLSSSFPYLNSTDIQLGQYSRGAGDGYFDPYGYMQYLKQKLTSAGVQFLKGEVVGGKLDAQQSISEIHVNCGNDNNKSVFYSFEKVVLCAGSSSGKVLDSFTPCSSSFHSPVQQIPVIGRRRVIHSFTCSDPTLKTIIESDKSNTVPHPLTVDPSGLWYRSEGRDHKTKGCGDKFLTGMSPTESDDDDDYCTMNLMDDRDRIDKCLEINQADTDKFNEVIWPILYNRVEAFGQLKHTGSW